MKNGRRAFFKAGTDEWTGDAIRAEVKVYRALGAVSFAPAMLAFVEDEQEPLLVLEDLSALHRPPPWSMEDVMATKRSIAAYAERQEVAVELGALTGLFAGDFGWALVADDRGPFLSLGFCTEGWLESALPTLLEAQKNAPLEGDDLVHADVRGDNLAIRGDEAVLFDWNWACRGNRDVDIAFWSPSLRLDGGPEPPEVLPGCPELAALVAGFFGGQAGLGPIRNAPRVREFQKRQASVALPWAVKALGLPPLEVP